MLALMLVDFFIQHFKSFAYFNYYLVSCCWDIIWDIINDLGHHVCKLPLIGKYQETIICLYCFNINITRVNVLGQQVTNKTRIC